MSSDNHSSRMSSDKITRPCGTKAASDPSANLGTAGAAARGYSGPAPSSGSQSGDDSAATILTTVELGSMGTDKGPLSVKGSRNGKKPCSTESSSTASPASEAVREETACDEAVVQGKLAGDTADLFVQQEMDKDPSAPVCITQRRLGAAPPLIPCALPASDTTSTASVHKWITEAQPLPSSEPPLEPPLAHAERIQQYPGLKSVLSLPLPGPDHDLPSASRGNSETNLLSERESEASSCEPQTELEPQSPGSLDGTSRISRLKTSESLEYMLICSISPRSALSVGQDGGESGSEQGRRPSQDSGSSRRSIENKIEKFFDVIDKAQGGLETPRRTGAGGVTGVAGTREGSPLREWHM
jgi:hypothetical protein